LIDEQIYELINEIIPSERFYWLNKIIKNVNQRGSNRFSDFLLENDRAEHLDIRILIGLQVDDMLRIDGAAYELYDEPLLRFDNGLIARLLPDFYFEKIKPYLVFGRQSYHLRGRASVVIGI